MNKEILFAQKLGEIRKLAKEQGNYVTKKQVAEAFAELENGGGHAFSGTTEQLFAELAEE